MSWLESSTTSINTKITGSTALQKHKNVIMKKAASPAGKTTPTAKGPASKPGASKCKLTYFDVRGMAEVSRLMFVFKGVQFDDVRIKKEDWPKLKPSKDNHFNLNVYISVFDKFWQLSFKI